MKKRRGFTLITVVVMIVFVTILCSTILFVYTNSLKQKLSSEDYDKVEYATMSGLSVMISYIVEHNDAFLEKYPSEFSSDGEGKYLEIPIESQDGTENFTAKVYVEEVVNNTSIQEYKLTSEVSADNTNIKISVKVTKDMSSGTSYSLGNYVYE